MIDSVESLGYVKAILLAQDIDYSGSNPDDNHIRLELCSTHCHSGNWTKPGQFLHQMLWLMAITTLYVIALFIFNSHIYGVIHLACWLTVPLLFLYNCQRGKVQWLGRVFYLYYPAHMAVIWFIKYLSV